MYRDMPYVMQLWNIYRSRAIGCWLQVNGIKVIVDVRFGDKRTYRCTCDGVGKHCVVAVGTHGTLKHREDRRIFSNGLETVVRILQPIAIVVYGRAPDSIFSKYRAMGIQIISFKSEFATSHEEVV